MITVQFATCDRQNALRFLQKLYPSCHVEDTQESAKPVLDWVEKDIVRIPDPYMHGSCVAVVPGNKWDEAHRVAVTACFNGFITTMDKQTSGLAEP